MIQEKLYPVKHFELLEYAKKWLHQKHSVVITEMTASSAEIPDAIGWTPYCSTLVECKTSVSDFSRDKKKIIHRLPEYGMGNYRYYFTPKGLIDQDLLPYGWGLIERWGKINRIIRVASFRKVESGGEMALLISAIRRIGQNTPDGVSVKCYTYVTKNTATLGVACQESK